MIKEIWKNKLNYRINDTVICIVSSDVLAD